MTNSRGFTLIEILIAVMLTGLLAGLSLAPVVITVRRSVDATREYSDGMALRRALDFIARDMMSAMRLSSVAMVIKGHEAVGGTDDDKLIFATYAPSGQGLYSGTVVYSLAEGGIMGGNFPRGLYRWIFPAISPADVDVDRLPVSSAQLVLPDVDTFRAEIPSFSPLTDKRKDYSGQLPKAVYLSLGRKAASSEESTERRLETIVCLP